jgi:hypothetical protein
MGMKALLADLASNVASVQAQQGRERAAEAIRNERRELIAALIQLAQQEVNPLPSTDPRFVEYPWHDSKHLSILLLGELRATEAVPVFLANLEYKNPRSIVGGFMDVGGGYPAAEALSRIGMPAVDLTVAKLGQLDPKSKTANTCCWILKEILGVKLARARIHIAIEEARDAAARENLRAALPYFRTPQEKAAEERAAQREVGN